MSTTHTPGPWYRDGLKIYRQPNDYRMSTDVVVCKLSGVTESDGDLMAAAPELLAACYAALSQLTEAREEYLQADIDQLKAAIAKATGIEPGEVTP